MHIEKWFLIPRWFIWGNNGREKDLKQKILTIGIVPVLKLFLIRAPELAQWIHACSWDKGDDDQKAAQKKKSSAQKFFPREIPCQRDKTYEVASFVKFYCVLLSRFYLLPCISLQGTANQAICNVLQP